MEAGIACLTIAHATMEPLVATARIMGGQYEVWAPVPGTAGTRELVAAKLGLKLDRVTVNVPLVGRLVRS